MASPRPSWRPLLAGTIALFLIILAFLAGQVQAGGDPALGGNAATQQAQQDAQRGQQQGAPPGFGGGGQDPSGDDGFVPGGTQPAPAVPDSSAPSTHQS